ncbi:hypothetical protein [Aeromonas veronii]|uniref:hypothetical protein n=1 Tax=Aeromonas veronii TaxID=654 RepID=UPI002B4A0A21|nr:hypothetical protein [Aeromonas veronii]
MNSIKAFIFGAVTVFFSIVSHAEGVLEEFKLTVDYNINARTCDVSIDGGGVRDIGYLSQSQVAAGYEIAPNIEITVDCKAVGNKTVRVRVDDSNFIKAPGSNIISEENPSVMLTASLTHVETGKSYSISAFYQSISEAFGSLPVDKNGIMVLNIHRAKVALHKDYTEAIPGTVTWIIPFIAWAD